jgi:hypothetical protein
MACLYGFSISYIIMLFGFRLILYGLYPLVVPQPFVLRHTYFIAWCG